MEKIEGARLWWITSLLSIALLLSSLESTIVSTALTSIATDLDRHGQINWIVIAYLLTYSSFLIIFARLSDVTGRKPALLTSICVFAVASLACGLAQSLAQLIVFRVFQGIGGSGIYALTMVLVAEISTKKHFGAVYSIINLVFVTASAVGPVIGGAITTYSTWRWCFLFNVPAGACVFTALALLFPKTESTSDLSLKDTLTRVDWLGLVLCLAACVMLIIPLQEGGLDFDWNSAIVIATIAVGGCCWIAFFGWEAWISRKSRESRLLPMMPNRVAYQRVVGACILNAFLTGILFTSTVIYLPQRFQVVNNLSPVQAGFRVIPALVVSAMAAVVSGLVLSKKNICSYFIVTGTSLQLLGCGLLSSLSTSASIPNTAYIFETALGLGLGTALISSFVLARIEVRREDLAPTVGTITQIRVFGGVIGLVICRVIQQSYLQHHLSMHNGTADPIVLISRLDSEAGRKARVVYGEASNRQWRVLAYIAAANLLVSLLTWRAQAKPLSIEDSSTEVELNDARQQEGDPAALGAKSNA